MATRKPVVKTLGTANAVAEPEALLNGLEEQAAEFARQANVDIEPEELLEPDVEPKDSTRFQAFKAHLHHYGNRALASASYCVVAVRDAVVHLSTALAGTIVLLPLVILVRGLYVLLRSILTSAKDIVLSVARAIFDVVRLPFQVVSAMFSRFNKQVLFPTLKRVKEDDTFAVIGLIVLVAAGIAVYIAFNLLTHRIGF